jgi:hypothetical protein
MILLYLWRGGGGGAKGMKHKMEVSLCQQSSRLEEEHCSVKDMQASSVFPPGKNTVVPPYLQVIRYSMQQSPSSEADQSAASREIPRIFMEPESSLPYSQVYRQYKT